MIASPAAIVNVPSSQPRAVHTPGVRSDVSIAVLVPRKHEEIAVLDSVARGRPEAKRLAFAPG